MQRRPFDLLDVMPAVLHGVILDFDWSRELLWGLDLPVEQMPVAELRWLLSMPVWASGGEHFQVSPAEVRADPVRHRLHHDLALQADLAFPLHVLVRRQRMVTVLDGFHRLLKADLIGEEAVEVKKVPQSLLDAIALLRRPADLVRWKSHSSWICRMDVPFIGPAPGPRQVLQLDGGCKEGEKGQRSAAIRHRRRRLSC